MCKSFIYISIAVMLCFGFVLDAGAADPTVAPPKVKWNKNVESLDPGTVIDVHLKIGAVCACEFVALEGNSIRVKGNDGERTFPQSAISKITVTETGSRKQNTIIAGIVATPLSFGLGYAMAPTFMHKDHPTIRERAIIGSIAGVMLGAIITGTVAMREPGFKEKVIYRSR